MARNKKEDKIIGFVYESTDYGKFTSVEFNRDVKESRFNKIKASFEEKEILNPITVNENFEIIDGQGRYEVCKALDRPVKYVTSVGANIEDCRRMNKYNTPWSNDDFVDSYARAGFESYARIKRIHEKTNASYTSIQAILGSSSAKFDLVCGNLQLSQEQEDFAYKVFEHSENLKKALMYTGRLTKTFHVSVRIMLKTEGYDPKRMLEKCKYYSVNFVMMNSLEGMLKQWSKAYNYKAKTTQKLYFEDYLRNKGHNVKTYDGQGLMFMATAQSGKSVKTLQ